MAGKGAVLAVRIISDAKGATKGFADTGNEVGKFERGLGKASVAAGALLGGMVAVAKEAYEAASAAQQSAGAVESVFGSQAKAIKALAADAAQAVGLSTNSYQELASVLGAQLKNMGFEGAKLTTQTDALIRTGADLAATFGGTTSDAVSALSSLLRGERDPIERYGIALNQAAIDARTTAMGLDKDASPAVKRAAQAQATLAIVAEQSADAQGAFGREADTAAGQTQRASAEFENAKAALGEALLPVVTVGAEALGGLAGKLQENADIVGPLVAVVATLAAGIMVLTAAQWLWNFAVTANPIGLIVIAVAALVAGIVVAYQKFDWFRDLIKDVWGWIEKAWGVVGGFITGGGHDGSGWSAPAPAGGQLSGVYGAAGGAVAAPVGLYGAPMTALAGGRSTAGQGPTGTVNVKVEVGVGDPVAIGRELDKILRKFAAATGQDVALTVGGRRA